MGNFAKEIEKKTERKEKNKISREELGKYFFDLSKLSFGAMVLGVIVPWITKTNEHPYWVLLIIGMFTTASLAFFGYKIIKN